MNAPFDTLAFNSRLKASGIEHEHADGITQATKAAMHEILTGGVATRADLSDLKTSIAELKTSIADLKTSIAELKTSIAERDAGNLRIHIGITVSAVTLVGLLFKFI